MSSCIASATSGTSASPTRPTPGGCTRAWGRGPAPRTSRCCSTRTGAPAPGRARWAPLHGQDICEERTPLEAASSWAVSFDKGDFRGREALLRQKETGITARLWGLRMQDRLIPRPHVPVYADDGQAGETTSGTFSPTLRTGIALGYLSPRDRFTAGDEVEVEVRGKRGRAVITKPPFVDRSPK